MSADLNPSVEFARVRTAARVAALRAKALAGLRRWPIAQADEAWLRAMLGHRAQLDEPIASNLWLREQATNLLIDGVLAHWRARPRGRRYAFVTFIDDSGNTLLQQPELNLGHFRHKVDHSLRSYGLNALVALEMQVLTNYPRRDHGNSLMLHAHALVWTDDPAWQADPTETYEAWAAEVGEQTPWTCVFEAAPVLPLIVGNTAGDFARVAAYLSKVPSDASRIILGAERNRLRSHQRDYRRDQALRVLEVLSQVRLGELIFGVAAGTDIVGPWRVAMRRLFRARRAARLVAAGDRVAVAARWAELRASFGNPHHRAPISWLAGPARPASIHLSPRLHAGRAQLESLAARRAALHAARARPSPLDEL